MIYLAIINTDTNICENVTVDDRPIEDILLPDPYIAIDLATTLAVTYHRDENGGWVPNPATMGVGGKGMLWDGEMLIQQISTTGATATLGN
jgi:hypothetical protein